MMRDRISVGLEEGAPKIPDVVRECKAVKSRARVCVVDRCLFTEKIRRDDESVTAGGPRRGELVEPLVDREASFVRCLLLAHGEVAHEPVERGPSGRRTSSYPRKRVSRLAPDCGSCTGFPRSRE